MKPFGNSRLAPKLTALAGAAGIAPVAHAAIVKSTTLPLTPPSAANTTAFWDIDGSSGNGFGLANGVSTFIGPWASLKFGNHHAQMVITGRPGSGFFADLALNAVVGPTLANGDKFAGDAGGSWQALTSNGNALNPFFPKGTPGYLGFKFTSGGTTDYGWASLLVTGSPSGQGFTIQQAYFDNSGAAIHVGAVPEPSSMALLALGATGLAAWRQRRKPITTQAA